MLLEGLLSADNALVLALLVRHLPKDQQAKALQYGLVGAFVLRGIGIALASYIIGLWWLCAVGAAYLVYLAAKHFLAKGKEDEHAVPKKPMGFWQTVAVVEFTDIVFAVDSILVAVALVRDASKLWIVYTGVFLGIVLLRLAAGFFIKLIRKYPTLDDMAYALVGWAGAKLAAKGVHLYGERYNVQTPELMPDALFWSVFAVIVVFGVVAARRHKTDVQDVVDQQQADRALDRLEDSGFVPDSEPHGAAAAKRTAPQSLAPGGADTHEVVIGKTVEADADPRV